MAQDHTEIEGVLQKSKGVGLAPLLIDDDMGEKLSNMESNILGIVTLDGHPMNEPV